QAWVAEKKEGCYAVRQELNGAVLAATNHEGVVTQYSPSILQEQVNKPRNRAVDDHKVGDNRAPGPQGL
ncbi:hypothetical protein COCMIDRAFT_98964, partial [Bipolaris oryzae ATCC 44560]